MNKIHIWFVTIATGLIGIGHIALMRLFVDTYTGGGIYQQVGFFGICVATVLVGVIGVSKRSEEFSIIYILSMAVMVDSLISGLLFCEYMGILGIMIPILEFFPLASLVLFEGIKLPYSFKPYLCLCLVLIGIILFPKVLWMLNIQ